MNKNPLQVYLEDCTSTQGDRERVRERVRERDTHTVSDLLYTATQSKDYHCKNTTNITTWAWLLFLNSHHLFLERLRPRTRVWLCFLCQDGQNQDGVNCQGKEECSGTLCVLLMKHKHTGDLEVLACK